ncbi:MULTISPECIES: hypothetical protein [Vibrio]|uniref:hypothetical protein n=1 Tax=Vibrio TaxID=662 RepID=UPI000C86C4A8|nr:MULTISPECIES: hypothetical protein [Vibrio]EJB8690878.1 hypothetical protein [Vibrio parahaemolyticus]ELA9722033.1 hypothetical protein [Vibrio parahaemolyticus]PMS42331.1 hypothetical protein C1T12_08385 [Vibrio parahaemolyticus]PMS63137.1 hypothetical protein C1S91_08375 [Vibrio parahaemolyticus]PMS69075.1 hypothetical protein C1S96_04565 [Vibrio parahaemolyticus]
MAVFIERDRNFCGLKELRPLGLEFLNRFQYIYDKYVTKKAKTDISGDGSFYHRIKSLLSYIATSDTPSSNRLLFVINEKGYKKAEYLDWQYVLDDYRDFVIEEKGKGTTSKNDINYVSMFLGYAADLGLWPQSLIITAFKLPPKLTPSMLTHNRAIPQGIVNEINNAIKAMDLDGENHQVVSMVSCVIKATSQEIKTKEALVHAATQYLNDNLKLLRVKAEKELLVIIETHKRAIKSANEAHNIEAANNIFNLLTRRDELLDIGYDLHQKEVKKIKRDICSYGAEGVSAFIYHHVGGIAPRTAKEEHEPQLYHNPELYNYLTNTICPNLNIDLLEDINDQFNLNSRAVALAQVILYIDTCKNESSIRFLKDDCLVENSGAYHLNDHKARADESKRKITSISPDPNIDRIDVLSFTGKDTLKLSVPDVISYLQSATKNYRAVAKEHYKDRLYLCLHKNNNTSNNGYFPAPPSGGGGTSIFTKVVADLTDGAIMISPYLIRKSSLKLTGLLTKDPLKVKEQAAHTSLSSTKAYLDQLGLSFSHELDIRDFQNALEALVTMDIEGFVEFVGINPDDYITSTAKAEMILKSHFGGVICEDPTSSPYAEKGETCGSVEFCPTCPKRRPVLLATENSILNTMLWNEALRKAFDELPEDEVLKWKLWRAFNQYSLDELEGNREIRPMFNAAKRTLAKHQDNNPYIKVLNL